MSNPQEFPGASRARYEYTFEEFAEHLDAHNSRPVDDARRSMVAFDKNILRLGRYFSEFYDGEELDYKVSTFIVIVNHLSNNQEPYDADGLGEMKDDGSLSMSVALQRAAHWYYTSRDRDDWGSHHDAVRAIKTWAHRWNEEEGEQDAPRNGA